MLLKIMTMKKQQKTSHLIKMARGRHSTRYVEIRKVLRKKSLPPGIIFQESSLIDTGK